MILNRLGNKKELANKIISYFPKDITCFIDLFFGSGAITWAMLDLFPNLYYIANDKDNDVFNLWQILIDSDKVSQLYEMVYYSPYHKEVYKYLIKEYIPKNEIEKAFKFLVESNYSLYGAKSNLLILAYRRAKENLLESIKGNLEKIKYVQFVNEDFRKIMIPIAFRENRPNQKNGQFVYADPPYVGTKGNYDIFTEDDSIELFDKLCDSELRFAYSEFDNPFILEQAKQRNLNVIEIGERKNIKNRRVEILITNYETEKTLFD